MLKMPGIFKGCFSKIVNLLKNSTRKVFWNDLRTMRKDLNWTHREIGIQFGLKMIKFFFFLQTIQNFTKLNVLSEIMRLTQLHVLKKIKLN